MNHLGTCGVECSACEIFGLDCPGCRASGGKPPWLEELDLPLCALYECPVMQKGIPDCSTCPDLPCDLYHEFRDPSVSPEAHEVGIRQRVKRLRDQ